MAHSPPHRPNFALLCIYLQVSTNYSISLFYVYIYLDTLYIFRYTPRSTQEILAMKDYLYYKLNALFRLEHVTVEAGQIKAIRKSGAHAIIYLHGDDKQTISVSSNQTLEDITNLWIQALHAEVTMTQMEMALPFADTYTRFQASENDVEIESSVKSVSEDTKDTFTPNTMQDVDDALELSLEGDAPTQTLNNETTTEPACDNKDNG